MPRVGTRVNDMFRTVIHADVQGCDTQNRVRPTPTSFYIRLPSRDQASRRSMLPLLLHIPHCVCCDKLRVSNERSRNTEQSLRL